MLLAPSLRPRCGSYWNTQACPGGSGHGNLTRSFPRKMTYKWWVKPTSEFPGGQLDGDRWTVKEHHPGTRDLVIVLKTSFSESIMSYHGNPATQLISGLFFLFKSKIWQFLGSPLGPLGRPENLDLSIWLPPFFPVLFRDPIVPPISGNSVIKILYVWMYVCLSLYMMFPQTSCKHECVEPQIRCRQLKQECLFDDCRFFFKM